MSIHAPYNFVPLSRFIYLPHWADQVSHDVPFSDGVSGTLTVELTCHTPTLVGGKQTKAANGNPGKVEFCKDPHGNPIIQPSSIKGMLSNVMEVSSFARFNRLDDKRYSVRDLSKAENFYLKQFPGTAKGGQAGWLQFNAAQGAWQITPCQMARIHQKVLIEHLNIDKAKWSDASNVRARYGLLKGINTLTFDLGKHKNKGVTAEPIKNGSFTGKLIVTGQPGQAFHVNKSAKKWEFVFYNPSPSSKLVPSSVMKDFLFIHSESDEWQYWNQNKKPYDGEGVPVFYKENGGKIESIGLSFLYKLAYKHSTHDSVTHTQVSHINGDTPDLPELIFGRISDQGSSIKGRVNIGIARVIGSPVYNNSLPVTILNGPKPTFYPAYMRQINAQADQKVNDATDYITMMDQQGELAGWKRYPVHNRADVSMPDNEVGKHKGPNNDVSVKLIPIAEDSKFQFNINFHNLREAELGALLWSLNFGDQEQCFHSLGMGKPYGLGRVSLQVTSANLIPMSDKETCTDALIEKSKASYISLMSNAYQQITTDHTWQQSSQLSELIAMATPQYDHQLSYMPLKRFAGSKTDLETLPLYSQETFKALEISSRELFNSDKNLNLLTDDDYQKQLQERQAEQQAKADAERKQAELTERKETATEEELLIINLEEMINNYQEKSDSKSRRKDLNQALQKATKSIKKSTFNGSQKQQCLQLIDGLEMPNMDAVTGLVKAIEKSDEES